MPRIHNVSDLDWLRQQASASEQKTTAELARAKAEAKKIGKEVFNFETLKKFYDPSSELGYDVKDPKGTAAALERRYYLDFPKVKNLRDFAAKLTVERTFR